MTDKTYRVELLPAMPGGGRHVEHDPASLAYTVEKKLAKRIKPRPVLWARYSPILDQGRLGACTGYAATGWLACAPHVIGPLQAAAYTGPFAVALYQRATALDRIAGAYPPVDTGSSGLAVAKAMRERGLISEYRHALSVTGLLRALAVGPVIVGVPWHESMDDPDGDGHVEVAGEIRGGHEFLLRGVEPAEAGGKLDGTARLIGDNSWGPRWARRGSFSLSVDGWAQLREERADVTIPVV